MRGRPDPITRPARAGGSAPPGSAGAAAEVRVLGPVEVLGPVGPAVLSGSRQRALVGLLALHTGRAVTPSRLIDALWGENPPRTALKTLYSHVTRVRQALADCGLPETLTRRGSGYLLALPRSAVDACRFEEQARLATDELTEAIRELTGQTGRPAGASHEAADRSVEAAIVPAVQRLSAALALWRGDALADAAPAGWAVAEVARLQEMRLTALEDRWDAELRLGRHRLAVSELERLVAVHPYRERLVGLHMLALYRCARHADALESYRRLRSGLAEELGIDPGAALQRLHADILRRSPRLDLPTGRGGPAPGPASATPRPPAAVPMPGPPAVAMPDPAAVAMPRPAQLPAPVGHFTGRAEELDALERLARDRDRESHLVVLSGPAGMGKTALAVQLAHRISEYFPDGQLFLDLRGHDREAMLTASDALCQVLRSLGVPAPRMPVEPVEQAGLYRSLVAGRRMLVVLDNAGSVDHLVPLVPATPTSLVVVTSRTQLTGLATRYAIRSVGLDVLTPAEAVALVRRVAGPDRVDREPEASADLVRLCGRMPLALRIAAAKLAADPRRTIGELVAELTTEDRLDALSVEGDSRSVRTVFASAYHGLSGPAGQAFRLIGLHPGTSFSAQLVAAGGALPLDRARAALAELAGAHLINPIGRDRYRCHDLIRLYALECGQAACSQPERDDVTDRLVDWYLAIADLANRAIDRGRDRVRPALRHRLATPPFAAEAQAALTFLDGERENMLPIVRYAAEHARPAAAWQLTYLLTGFFDSRGHWQERIGLCRWGLTGAERDGGPMAEGLMHSALGVALITTRRFDEALSSLHRALPLMRRCDDLRGEGHVYNNIAVAHCGLRNFDGAIEALEHAVAAHTADGHVLGIVLALSNRGDCHTQMGEPDRALEHLPRALELVRNLDNPRLEAIVLSRLGQAYLRRGEPDLARRHLSQAIEVRHRIGDRRHEAETLNDLGLVFLLGGDHPAALRHLERALALGREIADQHLEAVAANHIGRVWLEGGQLDRARQRLELALALRTRVPDHYEEANVRRNLGDLAQRAGAPQTAVEHWARAAELYRKTNAWAEADRLAAAVAAPPGPAAAGPGAPRSKIRDHP
ncbi:BTAD domain-containing putative transcriptional regulator [Plantactinospora sp. B6F1]|uniref:AfsR/SARP family transcriptional regulator n=1 Tax=Plantactinospora sp. B6F1 TaxID=3158971 RepID=UPI0032D99AAF